VQVLGGTRGLVPYLKRAASLPAMMLAKFDQTAKHRESIASKTKKPKRVERFGFFKKTLLSV
jgi:hypothetical protein